MTSNLVKAFGAFQLAPARRLLLRDDQPLKLGSRAFDLLLVLVEHHDRVVSKDELLDRVWPGEDVGEANLAVHVMALRKALGRAAIATVPGRGYRFTLPLRAMANAASAPAAAPRPPAQHNLALPSGELVGRASEVRTLLDLVERHPLVSVVGPGGVGKTRLAQQAAAQLHDRFPAGPWWIELAPLADPALVAAAVAQVLRVRHVHERDAVDAVATVLRTSPALLVLDNGEHVAEGVVTLVKALRQHAPACKVLVTSQEPLHLHAEQVLRLEPLALPLDDSLDSARASGAVNLFESRARLLAPDFRLDAGNCAAVVAICSRLDGIPLAIELAAARLPLLGLEGLHSRLGERFKVLTSHARTHLPRHQTLRATLDWSHGLLEDAEQRLLRRLSIFAGGFTLAAAQLVASDEDGSDALDEWGVLEKLGGLVDRSMVVSDDQPAPRFRLLETTRLYAWERLAAAGEDARLRERHARAMDRLLHVGCDDERLWRTPPAALPSLVAEVDNARAALEWAQTCTDGALAVSLAAGASHVFLTAALNAEYLQRVLPLRSRVHAQLPPQSVGLFWARIALACSRNAHPAGLDAALQAAEVYRALAEPGRLYDALTWALAIGARHGRALAMQGLVEEAEQLEQPGWPAALRSSYQWAKHRWLQSQGRTEEALQCAAAQAELLAQAGSWVAHVAVGANVADCELSLGRLEHAESLARRALDALDALGIGENIVGHVMDTLMVALTLLGRAPEAIIVGRRALRLLQREGDDLRLLDTLALNATTLERWADAARIAGHVDAAMAPTGEQRWPTAAGRRQMLEERLATALTPQSQARHKAEGAALTRDEAFDLALRDPASTVP